MTETHHAAPASGMEAPVAVEIVRNGLAAIADEMAITEVRAAYSTVVRDMLDFSTSVCDGQGRLLAQGLSLALQLGAIPRFMGLILPRIGTPKEGDVYLLNDPWEGGVHLPDFMFAKPIFVPGDAEPIAYATIVSHMVDVGGRFPGGISVLAASLHEEGLIIPLVKLVDAGTPNEALFDLIAANVRDPVKVLGDIRAVLAGLETGSRQVLELAERLGPDELRAYMNAYLDHTERATRAALARIPDGVSENTDYMDDDGVTDNPIKIVCRIEKRGERISFDFTGTDPQNRGGMNCTIADVCSVAMFTARAALDEDIAANAGFLRCVEWTIPEGSVANAIRPCAVGSRGALVYRLADAALGAMSGLVPDRIPANDGSPGLLYISGKRDDGSTWIFLDFIQTSWGATATGDGVPGAATAMSNAGNIPSEIIEEEFPLRIREYGLRPGTGGAGEFQGGNGVVREYELLADDSLVRYRLERAKFAPHGAGGGGDGGKARALIKRAGGEWEVVLPKNELVLDAGDRLRLEMGAGGGYGDPAGRASEDIERDVRDGVLSAAQAMELYGVEVVL